MKIKICHFTSVHPINDVRIFHKECCSLAAHGFDVTLIACSNQEFNDVYCGVKRISLSIPVKNRLQRVFRRSKLIFQEAIKVNADVYHFHDPELIPIGLKLKNKGKKVIYDSHEDTAVLLKTRKWIPGIFRYTISKIFETYEKYASKRFDAIISVTPLIVEKFIKINSRTYQVTNYPNLEIVNKCESRSNLAFAGSITQSYMFENVLEAISTFNDITLTLAGRPSSIQYLNKLKKMDGWEKVIYHGIIDHNEVQEIYNKSLIGIACHGYTPNVGYNKGTLGILKLFEFMHAGMAIVCSDLELWKNIIEKEQCGIYVNPYNVEDIKKAIDYLNNNKEIAKEMGNRGRSAVEREYNWTTQEKKLLEVYYQLDEQI